MIILGEAIQILKTQSRRHRRAVVNYAGGAQADSDTEDDGRSQPDAPVLMLRVFLFAPKGPRHTSPGRCPGLVCLGPFGAKSQDSATSNRASKGSVSTPVADKSG